ncbi:hypothetical protein [Arachidicoccus sp.]|jgi:hypothetical protein|uniref:hypothetical protein n=1 Tax=Arachidicoccus sp. TaxID=1872624 RepID=UPI003D1C8FCA
MNNPLIETYYTNENGYHPFFIRKHWQVAQLNYLPHLSFTTVDRLEKHQQTDEVFVLTKGKAVLIAATIENDRPNFECTLMQVGVTYNIAVNMWHSVAMDKATEIIIVEQSNTHLGDVHYYPLLDSDGLRLKGQILQLIDQAN